jgi:hypothetical protein
MADSFGLDQFDTGYAPENKPGELEEIPDGEYTFEIKTAKLEVTPNAGLTILRLELQVLGGPLDGTIAKHTKFLTSQEQVNYLGTDLAKLGFDSDTWNPTHKKKFSVELPKAVEHMPGIRFIASKSSREGKDKKKFTNLLIKEKVGFNSEAKKAAAAAEADPF